MPQCARCNRDGYIDCRVPGREERIWLCQLCAGDVLTELLAHIDTQGTQETAETLVGVRNGVALRRALDAVRLDI